MNLRLPAIPCPWIVRGIQQKSATTPFLCTRVVSTAIDMPQASALLTSFAVHHQVLNMGVDELLILCKKFKALSDAFPDDWVSPNDSDDEDADNYNKESCSRRNSSRDSRGAQTSRSKESEVEQIVNVRVCDEAVRLAKGAAKRTFFPHPLATSPTTPS